MWPTNAKTLTLSRKKGEEGIPGNEKPFKRFYNRVASIIWFFWGKGQGMVNFKIQKSHQRQREFFFLLILFPAPKGKGQYIFINIWILKRGRIFGKFEPDKSVFGVSGGREAWRGDFSKRKK